MTDSTSQPAAGMEDNTVFVDLLFKRQSLLQAISERQAIGVQNPVQLFPRRSSDLPPKEDLGITDHTLINESLQE